MPSPTAVVRHSLGKNRQLSFRLLRNTAKRRRGLVVVILPLLLSLGWLIVLHQSDGFSLHAPENLSTPIDTPLKKDRMISVGKSSSYHRRQEQQQQQQSPAQRSDPTDNGTREQDEAVIVPTSEGTNQLPTPVLVLSLPKSGTTTTQRFFNCGQRKSASHHWSNTANGTQLILHAECLYNSIQAGHPMLQDCGEFNVWTDLGALYGPPRRRGNENQSGGSPSGSGSYNGSSSNMDKQCFFPSVHPGGLEHIAQHYPTATIMLVIRNSTEWYYSAKQWNHGHFLDRLTFYCGPSFPQPPHNTMSDWIDFYERHSSTVRAFAALHTRMTYVEVSLESPDTPFVLQRITGIAAQCWGDCKPYPFDKQQLRRCRFPLLNESGW